MNNIERKRFKEILDNPQKFVAYLDQDDWVIFKKKEDIKGLTDEEIQGIEVSFLMDSRDLIMEVLNALKFKTIKVIWGEKW